MATETQGIFGVRNFEDSEGQKRSFWTRIGTAFRCKDGSWNLVIDYAPVREGLTLNMRALKGDEQ